jgi:hypothetical protein
MRFFDRKRRDDASRVRSVLTHPRATESLSVFGQVPLFSELHEPEASEAIRDADMAPLVSLPEVHPVDLTRGRKATSADIVATSVSIVGGEAPEGGEGGAPTTVPYVTTSASAALSNEKVLTARDGLVRAVGGSSVYLDVDLATDPGLEISSSKLRAKVDDSTIERAAGGLQVKDGGITYAKIQDVSANKVLGSIAGSAPPEEIDCTAAGRALLDDADASAQRTTLGLGSLAVLNSPLPIANGGSGQTTQQAAIDALTNVAGATDEHVLTKDTGTGNAIFKVSPSGVTDHGALTGLEDDDHSQYHNDTRGDARYYQQSEFINTSAGAGDSGKPIKLDAGGHIDATMINDADVDHDTITNTHDLTTDIDHDTITNTHDLTTDIDHATITNGHALPVTHENGGLEADVSAYDGLVKISGGATSAVSLPLGISDGGSGQTAQQAAINALTNVAAATNEHVLTKDTATGNAIFKAAAGGGASQLSDLSDVDSATQTDGFVIKSNGGNYLGAYLDMTELSDVAAKSGSGTTALFQTSPTITTPVITQINPGDSDFTLNVNSSSDRIIHLKNAGSGDIGIEFYGNAYYDAIITDTSSSGSMTVDWGEGNKHKTTLTENITSLTFNAPGGPCNLILEVIQGIGPYTIDWPASVKFPEGNEPSLSPDNSDIDIITFYYNGTKYYGSYLYDFQTPV